MNGNLNGYGRRFYNDYVAEGIFKDNNLKCGEFKYYNGKVEIYEDGS